MTINSIKATVCLYLGCLPGPGSQGSPDTCLYWRSYPFGPTQQHQWNRLSSRWRTSETSGLLSLGQFYSSQDTWIPPFEGGTPTCASWRSLLGKASRSMSSAWCRDRILKLHDPDTFTFTTWLCFETLSIKLLLSPTTNGNEPDSLHAMQTRLWLRE